MKLDGGNSNKKMKIIVLGISISLIVLGITLLVLNKKPVQEKTVENNISNIQQIENLEKIENENQLLKNKLETLNKYINADDTDLDQFEKRKVDLYKENKQLAEDMESLKDNKIEFETKYYGSTFHLKELIKYGTIDDIRFINFEVIDYEGTNLLKQTKDNSTIKFKNIDYDNIELKTNLSKSGYTLIQLDNNSIVINTKNDYMTVIVNNQKVLRKILPIKDWYSVDLSFSNNKLFINSNEVDTIKLKSFSKINIKVSDNVIEDLILQ